MVLTYTLDSKLARDRPALVPGLTWLCGIAATSYNLHLAHIHSLSPDVGKSTKGGLDTYLY